LIYCALVTTSAVVFLAALLGRLQALESCQSCQSRHEFKATFGHDVSFMSVDHKYDALWESEDGRDNLIYLPDEDGTREPLPAAISMCATA
jgi:hypothetical protein